MSQSINIFCLCRDQVRVEIRCDIWFVEDFLFCLSYSLLGYDGSLCLLAFWCRCMSNVELLRLITCVDLVRQDFLLVVGSLSIYWFWGVFSCFCFFMSLVFNACPFCVKIFNYSEFCIGSNGFLGLVMIPCWIGRDALTIRLFVRARSSAGWLSVSAPLFVMGSEVTWLAFGFFGCV